MTSRLGTWIKYRLPIHILTILGAHYHMHGDNPVKEKELIKIPCLRHLWNLKHCTSTARSRYNSEKAPLSKWLVKKSL